MTNRTLKSKPKKIPVLKRGAKSAKKKVKVRVNNGMSDMVRHVLDPVTTAIPPSLSFQANCFPINQTVRHDFDFTTGYDRMYFISGYGGSGTCGCHVEWDASFVATTATRTAYTLPLLATSAQSGGASSSKISKAGIRIVNSTANLYLAGRVYIARLDQRITLPGLPSTMTPAQWAALKDTIKALPDSMMQSYAANEFVAGGKLYQKCIPVHVVDEVDYNNYEAHYGTDTVDGFFTHTGINNVQFPASRPMSTIVVIFEKTAVTGGATTFNQNYTINMDAQYLTRWPLNTVPGLSAKSIVAAPAEVVTAARVHASAALAETL